MDTVVEYLATTRIGEKGQITVPKEFRAALGLRTGAPFAVLRLGAGLILLPEQDRVERLCSRIRAALAAAGASPGDVLASLPRVRRLYARRYGPGRAR